MTMAEYREADERAEKAWRSGFSFGRFIGLVLGLVIGGAVGFVAGMKIFS
jgi:tetrahydromethanopterin S-methyltransferase subunit G